jgi:hypothetical protein
MSAKVDECPAAGAPESLRRSKSRSSLLDVELSRATFVQKSEVFEVFRSNSLAASIEAEVGDSKAVVPALLGDFLDEPLLDEDVQPLFDVGSSVPGVVGDGAGSEYEVLPQSKDFKDGLVSRYHPRNPGVHIGISHGPCLRAIPSRPRIGITVVFSSHCSQVVLYAEPTCDSLSGLSLRENLGASGRYQSITLSRRPPTSKMYNGSQPDKFSGRACETTEFPEIGIQVSVDVDRDDSNQLLAASTEETSVAMWVDGDARREDVVDVLEDLAAEAEYLAGGRDA